MSGAVLVTRAEPAASRTARRLAETGYAPVVAPLLEIAVNEDAAPNLTGVQALLFSSANGARAFAQLAGRVEIPAFCVGDSTALAARQAGFSDVRSAEGDAEAMAMLARSMLDPRAGALLWASGADVARDITIGLRQSGFDARRAVVYRARMADRLPDAAVRALRGQALSAVLFHSARAAQAFVRLIDEAGLTARTESLAAICISARVADAVRALPWRRVEIALAPDGEAMLTALEESRRA